MKSYEEIKTILIERQGLIIRGFNAGWNIMVKHYQDSQDSYIIELSKGKENFVEDWAKDKEDLRKIFIKNRWEITWGNKKIDFTNPETKFNSPEDLHYLLQAYLSNKISTSTFCDIFTTRYNLETDHNQLNTLEHHAFSKLNEFTKRFSEFEEDLKLPNAYYNDHEVRKQALETALFIGIKI